MLWETAVAGPSLRPAKPKVDLCVLASLSSRARGYRFGFSGWLDLGLAGGSLSRQPGRIFALWDTFITSESGGVSIFVDHFDYNQDMYVVGRQRSLQGPRYSIYMYTFSKLLPVFDETKTALDSCSCRRYFRFSTW